MRNTLLLLFSSEHFLCNFTSITLITIMDCYNVSADEAWVHLIPQMMLNSHKVGQVMRVNIVSTTLLDYTSRRQ